MSRGGRTRDDGRSVDVGDRQAIYLGDNADGERLEKKLGEDKMKILEQAFMEAADSALPHPIEDAYLDACHTNNMIEFEPQYHVNFANPDIDEKPPMSLEEMLQKVKPFIVAYEGIQNQEEWEEAVKDVMARAPHMKELIDMYSGPDVVTAKQQEEELQRVANTLPENIPSSVKRFTDKTLLSLKEWEDPHLGRGLVFGGGHHSDTSHSKQLSHVVLLSLARLRRCSPIPELT